MIKKKYLRNKAKINNILFAIYSIGVMFCCCFTLNVLGEQISESLRLISYILCIYSLIKQNKNADVLKRIFETKWQKAVSILLEFYGAFSMTGMYVLDTTFQYSVQYSKILFLILSFIWVRPIVIQLLVFLTTLPERVVLLPQKMDFRTKLLLVVFVVLPCIFFLIGFNPAITSPDSEDCFYAAHKLWQGDFSMQDWHPPFYIFILNLLIHIYDSVTFIVIVQVICFAVVFVEGISFLYKCGFSRKVIGLFYTVMILSINNLILLTTLWKDIPYMVSLLWLTLLLMKIIIAPEEYKTNWKWYLQFVISIIFVAFFRQNGILPALAVVILLPIALRFEKKIMISSVICLLSIAFVKTPLYKAMNVIPVPQLKIFSLANDMMYSYYAGHEVSDDAMKIVNKVTDNNPEEFPYNAYWVHYNSEEPSGYSIFEFIKIYCKEFVQNPRDMIMAVLIRNSDIWSIVKPYNEVVNCVNYYKECQSYTPNVYPLRKENVLTARLSNLCNCITNNTVLYIFYWRTGIYNLLIVVMFFILFSRIKKNVLQILMPFFPVVMNLLALFISSGWPDYRYFWPNMMISVFLAFYFVYINGVTSTQASEVQMLSDSNETII